MKRTLILLTCVTLLFSGCRQRDPHLLCESTTPSTEETESFSQPVTEAPADLEAAVQDACTIPDEKYSNTEPGEKTSGAVDAIYSDTTIPCGNNSAAVDSTYGDTTISEGKNSDTVDPVHSDTVIPEVKTSVTVDPIHSDATIPEETKSKETEPPATTEPVRETEPPPTTEPPSQAEPTEPEETIPSQPVETEPEPEFDISYWISFAKNYAASIGLNLDATAVDCWDNPITAGSHCIYLERDITDRLNRYNRDEDITDVWIWAIDLGNGSYDIYIGYA